MNRCFLMTAVLSTSIAFSAYAGTDMKEMVAAVDTTPTSPPDAGFYVTGFGGTQFITDFIDPHQSVNGCCHGATVTTNESVNADWGGAGGIQAGFNFPSFPIWDAIHLRLQPAIQVEALYKGATSTSGFDECSFWNCNTHKYEATRATTNDSYNSGAGFVDGILRFKNITFVTPYVGIGTGAEYITIHGDATTNNPAYPHITGLDGSNLDFAGQVLAGLDFSIADHYSIFTEYKFIDAVGTDINTGSAGKPGTTYRFKSDQIQQNLVAIGFKYTF